MANGKRSEGWVAYGYRPNKKGEDCVTSKLTSQQVRHIRYSGDKAASLAVAFGVSPEYINRIRLGKARKYD